MPARPELFYVAESLAHCVRVLLAVAMYVVPIETQLARPVKDKFERNRNEEDHNDDDAGSKLLPVR